MVWLDRIIFYSLGAFVFILPVSIAGAETFTYLACVLFLVKRGIEISRKQPPESCVPLWIKVPLLVFLGVCGFSIMWSQAPGLSVKAFVGKSLMAALLLATVVGTVRDRERFIQILQVFLVAAFVLCLDGLWQMYSGYDIFRHAPLVAGRMSASMRHANGLGAYLIFPVIMALVFILGAWAGKKPRARPHGLLAGVLCFIVLCAALGFTFSRSAWLGGIVSVLAFSFMRQKHIALYLVILLLFGIVFVPMMASIRKVSFVSDLTTTAHFSMAEIKAFSASDRFNFWKEAIMIVRDYPVLGTGLNTYNVMIQQYSQHKKLYAHNGYLQMTVELGIVGLCVFLWFLWNMGCFVIRRIMPVQDEFVAILMAGLFAGWIGLLFQSGLDNTFYSLQLSRLLWFMMGMLVAGAHLLKKDGEQKGLAA